KIDSGRLEKPQAASGRAHERKHPVLAVNARGETLFAWAEGTGWQRGGSLVWQVHDRAGKPAEEKGKADRGIPVWGLPAAVAHRDQRLNRGNLHTPAGQLRLAAAGPAEAKDLLAEAVHLAQNDEPLLAQIVERDALAADQAMTRRQGKK